MTTLDFVAPDDQVYGYWTDGINALLGNCFSICFFFFFFYDECPVAVWPHTKDLITSIESN